MKYMFILGRNVELSKQEVFSYFERMDNKVENFWLKENGLIVEVEKPLAQGAISFFGGVIAIGEIFMSGNNIKDLENIFIYKGTANNFNYCIWSFANEAYEDDIRAYLKQRFKSEKLKAAEKGLTGRMTLQKGEKIEIVGSKNIQEQYFILEEKGDKFFGRITETCDYEALEKRDMEKPERREELAISPRLSKIMINLSLVKNGPLLDAFCGIGGVLFEALLQGIPVIGVDADPDAIDGARKNLAWGKFNQKDYQIINNNSKKVRITGAEVMVSEPDLGRTHRRLPLDKMVEDQLREFIVKADNVTFGTEEFGPVVQLIDVAAKSQRYSIETQVGDLLDELLSTVPSTQRTPKVLNYIHRMIDRFKQLRDGFSTKDQYGNVDGKKFKEASYKPLSVYFKELKTNNYGKPNKF